MKTTNFLDKIGISRLLVIVILEIALVFGLPFAKTNNDRALADSVVSNQDSYRIEKSDKTPYFSSDNSLHQEKADNAESIKEKVIEKLNLNEPVPPSTKKFFKQIKGEEPIEQDTSLPQDAKTDLN
jgi:hypothetical protein